MTDPIKKAARLISKMTPSSPRHFISEDGYEDIAKRVFEIFRESLDEDDPGPA